MLRVRRSDGTPRYVGDLGLSGSIRQWEQTARKVVMIVTTQATVHMLFLASACSHILEVCCQYKIVHSLQEPS